mgnify:CR=1 FL=1
MQKLLIISYYWPPSGGAGVQRWVKLTKYLSAFPIEIHVLTVKEDKASYMHLDYSLQEDVSQKVEVHKTSSFEPIRYYGKLVGKKNVPTAGFSNVDTEKIGSKIINFIRSNIFIPDPRRAWNRFAFKKAASIIRKHGITHVITSSPPHSSQLIGLKLKSKFDIKWISDLRDPWTDIYYYSILGHSSISKRIDASFERRVIFGADSIITVSEQLKKLFIEKVPLMDTGKFLIVPNGYDPEDFRHVKAHKTSDKTFTICYTGTISTQYQPEDFFRAFKKLVTINEGLNFKIKFIGTVAPSIKKMIMEMNLIHHFEHVPTVPHDQIVGLQSEADALLLVIPAVPNAKGILTGKIFEYLASNRAILCLGPEDGDAAAIISTCSAGRTFERGNQEEIFLYLTELVDGFQNNMLHTNNMEEVEKYSRKKQAAFIYDSLIG